MSRKLTLSKPWFSRDELCGTLQIKWILLDGRGKGYLISWLNRAVDTGKPECMAFLANVISPSGQYAVLNWMAFAVSHDPDAALALEEVLRHLEEEYGYEIVDDGARAILRPGEVVSNGRGD